MIIVAIPKSASTSLMLTLGKYHGLEAKQDFSLSENDHPENCQVLFKLHSDVRELTAEDVARMSDSKKIFKQHIFPSPNNLELLDRVKKVVLLRSCDEIIKAYRRGAESKVHNLLEGYTTEMSEEEWIQKSKTDGLYADLQFFTDQWKSSSDSSNTVFVSYEDYLVDARKVLNQIESLYDLPLTTEEVDTIKARYSRRTGPSAMAHRIKEGLQRFILQTLQVLGLKDLVKKIMGK